MMQWQPLLSLWPARDHKKFSPFSKLSTQHAELRTFQGRAWQVVATFFAMVLLSACETYTYLPSRTKVVSTPAAAPEEQAAPASPVLAQPTAPPSLDQRLRDLEERLQRLDDRLSQLEAPKSAKPIRRETGRVQEQKARGEKTYTSKTTHPAAGYPAGPDPQEKLYQEGKRLYDSKKYSAAREKFSQYLTKQAKGSKSAEARYHLADSFYQEKHYQEAAVEFNKLVHQHPKHLYAPAALLRQAYCYDQLNRKTAYRQTMRKLVDSYPQSPEAKEAEKELKGQGKRQKKP